jgi:hypothetical protein
VDSRAITGVTVAGGNGYGSGAQQLASPKDVFVDAVGNVFVTDADNNACKDGHPVLHGCNSCGW